MLTMRDLTIAIAKFPADTEVRVGDVAEGHDLHCSIKQVVMRSGMIVLVPGDDDIWQDETLSSEVLMENLWPEEETSED